MIDNRIHTFLTLCQEMNYRRTAEVLNMSQPAVTQHIHYLEEQYGCRLFSYQGRVLRRTEESHALERHARTVLYNEAAFCRELKKPPVTALALGATKTIGDYVMEERVMALMEREDVALTLVIDNTERLLARLNARSLDLLLIEGYFDRGIYGHRLMRQEGLVGICTPDHPFAGRAVALEALFDQHLILREEGSGTRSIFTDFLHMRGYGCGHFREQTTISSFRLICQGVATGRGISFVYQSIPQKVAGLATFSIQGAELVHEFNYVYLKGANVEGLLGLLEGSEA